MLLLNRKTFFWFFQMFFWILYFVFVLEFIHGEYPADRFIVAKYCLLLSLFGIPITLLIRKLFELPYIKNLSILQRLIVMVISSFVGANIWLVEIRFLDHYYLGFYNIPYGTVTWEYYIWEMVTGIIVLSVWTIMFLLFSTWRELTLQKTDNEKALLFAQNSQLELLRYQINPHFLFNSLNSIRALIYKSPPNADKMISKLSDFMRYSLSNKNEKEIPLEEEIEIIKGYLDIEKVRFGDKLKLDIKIDAIANEYPIPPFLILPLVENAIKYGMKTSKMPLHVFISAEVIGSELIIGVCNSGVWFHNKDDSEQKNNSTGIGLNNIKNRLKNLYPKNHKFSIIKNNENVNVRIMINKELSNYDKK